jgi:transcriptional regulator with XRE-family HTH domain
VPPCAVCSRARLAIIEGVRSEELGHCIRAWRDRLDPAAAGLAASARRRAPGLRREELASLAGVSVDYLSRLEQGRANNPSPQVLAALARALCLTDEERRHLYLVAGQAAPGAGTIDRRITPGVQRMIDRLEELPVLVYDAGWDLVATNRLGAALVGDMAAPGGRERNLVWRQFNGARSRFRRAPEQTAKLEAELVADLHAAATTYPEDERLAGLIADLRAASPRFEETWRERPVAVRASDRKTIEHPEIGPITVDCDILKLQGTDLRLIVYSAAPDTPDAEALARLAELSLEGVPG